MNEIFWKNDKKSQKTRPIRVNSRSVAGKTKKTSIFDYKTREIHGDLPEFKRKCGGRPQMDANVRKFLEGRRLPFVVSV